MRSFLISAALVSTALTAVPAMAQDYGRHGAEQRDTRYGDRDRDGVDRRNWNGGPSRQAVFELNRDLDRIEARIQRSLQRGTLSRREAFGLNREVIQIRFQLRRAQRDGISGRELGQFRFQINRLEQRLRFERDDRNGRRY